MSNAFTVKDITKKTILTSNLKKAVSFLDLSLGLLRKSNPASLLFKTRFGIHTFGLKKPIDVLILDNNFRVVKIKQSLQPNRLFFWNPKYNLVLELPRNSIKNASVSLCDKLSISI